MTLPHLHLDRPNNLNNRRKFSFPASLHTANLLGSDIAAAGLGHTLTNSSAISARRRLSNVSDVVTRKLSNTIGWKSPQIPAQEIITQGKCLCGQYIRSRLKRAGVFNRRLLGLQRMRSIVGTTPTIQIMREVFPALSFIGEELERMHPRTYNGICRQISRSPGGDLQSPENTAVLLGAIARELFKTDITWGKVSEEEEARYDEESISGTGGYGPCLHLCSMFICIIVITPSGSLRALPQVISLFAVSGGMAVECVRQGHPDFLPKLVEGVGDAIEDELISWINENGGWIGLSLYVRPVTAEFTPLEWIAIALGCLLGMFLLIFLLKFIGFHVIPGILFQ